MTVPIPAVKGTGIVLKTVPIVLALTLLTQQGMNILYLLDDTLY